MDPWFIIGQKIKERNQQNQLQTTEDAYNGLLSSIEAYKAGDKDYAGQKMTQNLQDLGLLDKSRGWQPDDTSPDRIKLIEAATKNFNNGHYTAQELYDRLGHAINGDFGQKLSKNQRQALSTVQQAQQSKLAPQYLSALTSDPTTGQGVANRLSLVNKTDPSMMSQIGNIASLNTEALSDPAYAPYMSDIGSYVSQESPQLMSGPLSDQALMQKFATDAPGGAVTSLLSKDYLTQLKDANKTQKYDSYTDNQLYTMAESKDPELSKMANQILSRKQNEKIKLAKIQQDAKISGIGDIADLSKSVINGESALSDISNVRGVAAKNMTMNEIRKDYPKFNFIYSEANKKYIQSSTNARIIGAVDASLPRINMLADQAENLKNSDLPAINAVMKQILTQTGSPTYTNFESNRNAIVQEVNTALSGSSQSSDMRVKIELENLRASRSPEQLLGSIANLREALIARKDASQQYIYPMEVVRGEKTQEQWKKEMEAKYRGKYGNPTIGNIPQSSGSKFTILQVK